MSAHSTIALNHPHVSVHFTLTRLRHSSCLLIKSSRVETARSSTLHLHKTHPRLIYYTYFVKRAYSSSHSFTRAGMRKWPFILGACLMNNAAGRRRLGRWWCIELSGKWINSRAPSRFHHHGSANICTGLYVRIHYGDASPNTPSTAILIIEPLIPSTIKKGWVFRSPTPENANLRRFDSNFRCAIETCVIAPILKIISDFANLIDVENNYLKKNDPFPVWIVYFTRRLGAWL